MKNLIIALKLFSITLLFMVLSCVALFAISVVPFILYRYFGNLAAFIYIGFEAVFFIFVLCYIIAVEMEQ